ncbi:MFS transporter [Actinomadura sp. KC06]|uniref:MFS transporter n=1 Tax=Actinomadura sp. KC06 TaxID=2530369 RepID=UPI00105060C2|nr:MFS transporter [Actinomadura sp. KC06]TDD36510.1 MFS transporter [Actinomadura sp. KC06]
MKGIALPGSTQSTGPFLRRPSGRLGVIRQRNFRVFFIGYCASQFGTEMASVALVFAILHKGGSLTDLSCVLAARIVPMVLLLLGGGLLGDRFPRRWVMPSADCLRVVSQSMLALLFFVSDPPLWSLLLLVGLNGVGEALFQPSFNGMIPSLVPSSDLHDANALISISRSATRVGGPALAGLLIVVIAPAAVLAIDAISYLISIVALLCLRITASMTTAATSLVAELKAGWRLFRAHTWLWITTLQFAMFNLIVWAPYLVLGPAAADQSYGGARAWGTVVALYGAGSILGGLLLLGRRPQQPLVVSTIVAFAWAAPSATLAARAPLPVVCVGAVAAGIASSVFTTLMHTSIQERVPPDAISRVMSYVALGSYAAGPIGLALAGPIATVSSISVVLSAGAAWQIVANATILTLPAIRNLRRRSDTAPKQPQSDSLPENEASG